MPCRTAAQNAILHIQPKNSILEEHHLKTKHYFILLINYFNLKYGSLDVHKNNKWMLLCIVIEELSGGYQT